MAAETRFDPLATKATQSRGRKWLWRAAIAFVLMFVGVAVTYGVWRNQALAARDAEIAKLRAAGEPVWFSDLRPEPLDPAIDGTPLLQQAFDAMTPLPEELADAMHELHHPPEVSRDDWGDEAFDADFDAGIDDVPADIAEEPPPDNVRAEGMPADEVPPPKRERESFEVREKRLVEMLRPHVEVNRATFELVEQALAKGRFQFKTDYDEPIPFLREYPERDSSSHVSKLLDARWRCQLHDSDVAAAGKSCELKLRYATATIAQTDSVISALINVFRANTATESISETAARGGFDATLAARLDRLLVECEATLRYRPTLVAERAEVLTVIENIMENGNDGQPFVNSGMMQSLLRPVIWENQARYLDSMATRIECADRYDEEAVQALSDQEAREAAVAAYPFMAPLRFGQMMLPFYSDEHVREARDRLRAARVGIRLDAYRRKHGRFPKSLDDIKDDNLAKIPTDVASGQPLVLLMDTDAFTICPAAYVDIERKHLAEEIQKRDAKPEKPKQPDPDNVADAVDFFPDIDDDESNLDKPPRTGAFRVVYPRTLKLDEALNDAKNKQ